MTLSDHLPVLLVLTPLLGAPIVSLFRSISRPLATLLAAATAAIAWGLVQQTADGSELNYHLGGWAPPIGIEYEISMAAAWTVAVVSTLAFFSILAGCHNAAREVTEGREHLYYAAFLLCLAGLLGMATTGDAFNVFVFLEISSLSTYTLVAMGKGRRSFTAAFNYLILGTIGGTFILLGIGLAFQATGSLNIDDIAARIQDLRGSRTVLVAFGFLATGLSIKLAVFPLHQWLPGAYAESPTAVGAFLAGTATKVIYFQLIRVCVMLFGASYVFEELHFGTLLRWLSVFGMFVGSLAAVYQTSLKRLLAFSSIGQVGYLTLALSLGSELGVRAGLLHLAAHGITKCALFLVTGAIVATTGSDRLSRLAGFGKRRPLIAFAFVVGGIGLIGVPGTAGFVSKWALLRAAFESGHTIIAVLSLASSMIAVVYVWRVVEVMYLKPSVETDSADGSRPWALMVPASILLAVSAGAGLYSAPATAYASRAASTLWNRVPVAAELPEPRPVHHDDAHDAAAEHGAHESAAPEGQAGPEEGSTP
ncbi:MAG: monovalent cation/H+ antiporter subunit D family protein [Myxococcota bacterium]